MNCRDISSLLDDSDVRDLTVTQLAAVEFHVSHCRACAASWQAHRVLSAYPMRAMDERFPERLWIALEKTAVATKPQRTLHRNVAFGTLIFAGVATAMIALSIHDGAVSNENRASLGHPEVVISEASAETAAVERTAFATGEGAARISGVVVDESASAGAARPHRLVVLPAQHRSAPQGAVWIVEDIQGAIVRVLQSVQGLEVVEAQTDDFDEAGAALVAKPPESSWGDPAADLKIAGYIGGTHFLRVLNHATEEYESSRSLSFVLSFGGPSGSDRAVYYIEGAEHPWPSTDATAVRLAERIQKALFPEIMRPLGLSRLTDARLEDRERLDALRDLAREGVLSDEEAAAAIELARSALAPQTRVAAWQIIGATTTPAAMQPLSDALLNDQDRSVRAEAATGLARYLEDSTVRAALEAAAAGDPSLKVRLHAQWELITDAERQKLVSTYLRDTALSSEERLVPFLRWWQDNGVLTGSDAAPSSYAFLDESAVTAAIALARDTGHPDLWLAITDNIARNPAYIDVLIEASRMEDVLVAMAATRALTTYHSSVPRAREAVVEALERVR